MDRKLAEKLQMGPGRYYCYYKPTYLNGYEQQQGQDIDYEYIQAVDGACRDEFIPDESFLNSSEFEAYLKPTNGLFTQKTEVQSLFELSFRRTYNIE